MLTLLLGCRSAESFGCGEDGQCESAGITGTCESNGYCSFLDDTCASGRRYGDLAGGGLAGVCVQEELSSTGLVSTTDAEGSTAVAPATSSTSSGAAETTGDFSCEPTGVCSNDPLPGWSGPILLEPAGKGACGGEPPSWTAGTGLVPQNACDCTCEGEAEVQCQFVGFSEPECDGANYRFFASTEGCEWFPLELGLQSIASFSEGDTYCSPPAPLNAALEQVFAACQPTTLGACEDGTSCIEESPEGSVCDWRDGVHDCPSPRDQRTVLHRAATGGYDCGCQCGSSGGCDTLQVFLDPECETVALEASVPQFPDCAPIGSELMIDDLYLRAPSVQCEDLGSRNTAEPLAFDQEPTEVDPVTLCCR